MGALPPFCVYRVCLNQTGLTYCAMAHTKPASSRAIATTILLRLTRTCRESAKASAQPHLCRPGDVERGLGHIDLATCDQCAHLGGVLIGPCRFHQCPPGRAVAGFGDAALLAMLAGGIFTGDQAKIAHKPARIMVWTPPYSTGIEVPKWRCNPTTSERERHHEDYDDWGRFGKDGIASAWSR